MRQKTVNVWFCCRLRRRHVGHNARRDGGASRSTGGAWCIARSAFSCPSVIVSLNTWPYAWRVCWGPKGMGAGWAEHQRRVCCFYVRTCIYVWRRIKQLIHSRYVVGYSPIFSSSNYYMYCWDFEIKNWIIPCTLYTPELGCWWCNS